MRRRATSGGRRWWHVAPMLAALALGASGAGAQDGDPNRDARGWSDLVAGERAEGRAEAASIVVLRAAPAGSRRGATGGDGAARAARREQDAALAAIRRRGVDLRVGARATKTVNAVVAAVRPDDAARLLADPRVVGVYPVRSLVPAGAFDAALAVVGDPLRPLDAGAAGDGHGVTVAVLDGPVDATHPYLAGRVDGVPDGAPAPTGAAAVHGTAVAGLVAGAGGPHGLRGVAPRARILPLPVLRAGAGGAPTGTTVDLLAALERAADPNGDGDLADRARVVVAAVEAPLAGFADAPEARAVATLDRLGTVVVAAAGNDGATGARYGTVGSPASAPEALAVGATDGRAGLPEVSLDLHGGVTEEVAGVPLGGLLAPQADVKLPIRAARADAATVREAYRGSDGRSLVDGAVALVRRDRRDLGGRVAAAAAAGARAVLVHGQGDLPAGALGADDRLPIPVVGLDEATGARLEEALGEGREVVVTFGAAASRANGQRGAVAPFSSTGLAFGDVLKPDVVLPGVAVGSSLPGGGYATLRGTSAAAAQAAGLVAALASAHPDWSAARLRSAVVSTAELVADRAGVPAPVASQGGGRPTPARAATAPIETVPASLSFGRLPARASSLSAALRLANRSAGPRAVELGFVPDRAHPQARLQLSASQPRLVLPPGAERSLRVTLSVDGAPEGPAVLGGWLVLRLDDGSVQRVPVAAAVPGGRVPLVRRASLSRPVLAAGSAATPPAASTLEADLGGVVSRADGRLVLVPVERLTVTLLAGDRRLGAVHAARQLLPGRYAWSVAARRPGGGLLEPGRYRFEIRALSPSGARSVASVPFTVR